MLERPKVNYAIKLEAAKKISEMMEDANPETIADLYHGYMDGYELARELDRACGWDITAHDVDILDCMSTEVDAQHEAVCKKWFEDNDIQPPLEIGTKITRGVITGICEYRVAKYLVKEDDLPDAETGNRRLLVRFEDALAL